MPRKILNDLTHPAHFYFFRAAMDPIMDIGRQHKLYVIEDAAQAIGSEYGALRAVSLGHLGYFIFFPAKCLGGFSDARVLTTKDPELANRMQRLCNHGYRKKYYNQEVGGNVRSDALPAAVLRIKDG